MCIRKRQKNQKNQKNNPLPSNIWGKQLHVHQSSTWPQSVEAVRTLCSGRDCCPDVVWCLHLGKMQTALTEHTTLHFTRTGTVSNVDLKQLIDSSWYKNQTIIWFIKKKVIKSFFFLKKMKLLINLIKTLLLASRGGLLWHITRTDLKILFLNISFYIIFLELF